MSPLWSDMALARAAWDKAIERGLVDERDPAKAQPKRPLIAHPMRIRRLPRPRLHSFAL